MKKFQLLPHVIMKRKSFLNFYNRIKKFFDENLNSYNLELIIVDNDSSDGSIDILKNLAEKDKSLKIILNNVNYGLWRSTFNAIKYVSGDALIPVLPVDMQDPPELIIDFVKKWEERYDVVYELKKKEMKISL